MMMKKKSRLKRGGETAAERILLFPSEIEFFLRLVVF
jgi:hypothetical protein